MWSRRTAAAHSPQCFQGQQLHGWVQPGTAWLYILMVSGPLAEARSWGPWRLTLQHSCQGACIWEIWEWTGWETRVQQAQQGWETQDRENKWKLCGRSSRRSLKHIPAGCAPNVTLCSHAPSRRKGEHQLLLLSPFVFGFLLPGYLEKQWGFPREQGGKTVSLGNTKPHLWWWRRANSGRHAVMFFDQRKKMLLLLTIITTSAILLLNWHVLL